MKDNTKGSNNHCAIKLICMIYVRPLYHGRIRLPFFYFFSASQSEKETPASQISISKAVGRGRRTTAVVVKTTPISIKIGGKSK